MPDSLLTDERLLEIIVEIFQHGEFNRIRLANKAISNSKRIAVNTPHHRSHSSGESMEAIDRIMRTYDMLLDRPRRQRRGARQGDPLVATLVEAAKKIPTA